MGAPFLCLYLFGKFWFHVLPPPPPHTDSGKIGFEKERERGEGVNHINRAPPTYAAETNGALPTLPVLERVGEGTGTPFSLLPTVPTLACD